MNVQTKRWLLAPIRQWRTRRLMADHGPSLPYDIAWALITFHTAPDEARMVRAWTRENAPADVAGLHHDDWHALPAAERVRRQRWLLRHGRSPIQQLGIDPDLFKATGIRVVDWGSPDRPS